MVDYVRIDEARGTMEQTWGKELVGESAEQERRRSTRPRHAPALIKLVQALRSAVRPVRPAPQTDERCRPTHHRQPHRSAG